MFISISKVELISWSGAEGQQLANCPAVFLLYFLLWICYDKYKDPNEPKKSAEAKCKVAKLAPVKEQKMNLFLKSHF